MPMNARAAAFTGLSVLLLTAACNNNVQDDQKKTSSTPDSFAKGSYGYDLAFLKKYSGESLELRSADGQSKVLLSAKYQGRVLTSTATGDSGTSFGWLNYDLLASKTWKRQFNPVGGEERFWMGPEGGQYSIYFAKGDSFKIDKWQVPAFIDTISYKLDHAEPGSASFSTDASFTNYSGTPFSVKIERRIRLLDRDSLQDKLKTPIPGDLNLVGFETINTITNTGAENWNPSKGLLSVWLLGMYTPGPGTKVIIPFRGRPDAKKLITTDYFGQIPPDRLLMADSVLYFTCDGKYRSKLGLSPHVAKPLAAAFDFKKNVLTLVIPQIQENAAYVNSKWELQKTPYNGDAINTYNDGPLADGSQLGPFFEIESSSPALQLNKGAKSTYRQLTCHLQGDFASLQSLVKALMGVDLALVSRKDAK